MEITIKQAKQLVKQLLKAKLVPNLLSSPGIGKSSLAQQVANDFNLELIDVRLAGYDPTLIDGYITLNPDNPKATTKPLDVFPIEGDTPPPNKKGWLILLDEFTSAPRAVQAACYRLILDRQVGGLNLHENVAMIIAGNKETDNAIASSLGTALQSRVTTLQIRGDTKAWVEWAIHAGIDDRVISYVQYTGDRIATFDPNHNDVTFLCGRTAEFLSQYLTKNNISSVNDNHLPAIAGMIGEGDAIEFNAFCSVALPDIPTLIANPATALLPTESGVQFLLSGALVTHLTDKNMGDVMSLINRLPIEIQFAFVTKASKAHSFFRSSAAKEAWIMKSAAYLI